jgi:hypothetical protein
MAKSDDHEYPQLASRLTSAADGIVNAAAANLERDLRSAAEIINEIDKPVPLIPRLMSDLAKIANACPDAATARKLRRLLGEVQ